MSGTTWVKTGTGTRMQGGYLVEEAVWRSVSVVASLAQVLVTGASVVSCRLGRVHLVAVLGGVLLSLGL